MTIFVDSIILRSVCCSLGKIVEEAVRSEGVVGGPPRSSYIGVRSINAGVDYCDADPLAVFGIESCAYGFWEYSATKLGEQLGPFSPDSTTTIRRQRRRRRRSIEIGQKVQEVLLTAPRLALRAS